MRRFSSHPLFAGILIVLTLSACPKSAIATDTTGMQNLHFPKPPLLKPNVEFWKQIYTAYGVSDFVLHDRENLGVIYGVVSTDETTHQARAADLARPAVHRMRITYQDVLSKLAADVPPDELGPDGRLVWQAWGCPCPAEVLRRAADNIRAQQGLRQTVDDGLRRAQALLPRILPILREHDVPVELAALPLVESAYNPNAYSKAGAVGLWQFIRSTGKKYLTITHKRDDRRDPLRATDAAAHLLRHNYEALGSWPLAIVAYNHGREGMLTARAAVGSDAVEDIIARYTGPRFGFASKNFYAEFLAALEIVQPFLNGQDKPNEARARQRGAQNVSVSTARPPVRVLAPPGPPPFAARMRAEPPTEASPPAARQAPAEHAIPAEPTSVAPDLTPLPMDAAESQVP